MRSSTPVRALALADAEVFSAIRAQAIAEEPLSFMSGPDDDRNASIDFVRRMLDDPTQAVFGAFVDDAEQPPALVGIVGILREPKRKRAHRALLWGLYVVAPYRGRSVGRALLRPFV